MSKWIVLYEHDHEGLGFVVGYTAEPTTKQLVRCLDLKFKPSIGESINVFLLEDNDVQVLDWQDSDGEEFDEFADKDEAEVAALSDEQEIHGK